VTRCGDLRMARPRPSARRQILAAAGLEAGSFSAGACDRGGDPAGCHDRGGGGDGDRRRCFDRRGRFRVAWRGLRDGSHARADEIRPDGARASRRHPGTRVTLRADGPFGRICRLRPARRGLGAVGADHPLRGLGRRDDRIGSCGSSSATPTPIGFNRELRGAFERDEGRSARDQVQGPTSRSRSRSVCAACPSATAAPRPSPRRCTASAHAGAAGADKNLIVLGTLGKQRPVHRVVRHRARRHQRVQNLTLKTAEAEQQTLGAIAEALVATAVGLMVAIPAVIAFNYFSRKLKVVMGGADEVAPHRALARARDPSTAISAPSPRKRKS